MAEFALVGLAPLLLSVLLTAESRKFSLSRGVLDVPNERSSHAVPTPRGGGIAIVLSTITTSLVLLLLGRLGSDLFLALSGGGLSVAIVGFIDDRWRLSAGVRLAVHVGAAIWALAWLGGLPPLRIGDHTISFGWAGYVFGVLGIVWVLNLFNFMDGIDGIAASEAVFIAWGAALLAAVCGLSNGVSAAAIVFGAACAGFLTWNWPPAKIFMGDVGSGFLGFVLAVIALAHARENPVALLVWLILGGVFFVDASVTFVRRLIRGERVYEAHRSHAYQWLARRWKSHRRVTVVVLLVNVFWLLPWAFVALSNPGYAGWAVLSALAPIVVMAIVAGAGRSETRSTQ